MRKREEISIFIVTSKIFFLIAERHCNIRSMIFYKKSDLTEVFDNKESNALNSIDETYFSDQIDRIRRLERQRTLNLV